MEYYALVKQHYGYIEIGTATVIVYNISGAEMTRMNQSLVKGNNQIDMDLNGLSAGMYFINLSVNGEAAGLTKIIKQ